MKQQETKESFMSSFVLKNKKRFNDEDDLIHYLHHDPTRFQDRYSNRYYIVN